MQMEIHNLRTRLNESETSSTSNFVRLNADMEEMTLTLNQSAQAKNKEDNDEEKEALSKNIENALKKEITTLDSKFK